MRRLACIALFGIDAELGGRLHAGAASEGAVRRALERVAETAMAFGPAVAFDVGQAVVWVDISGCAHLHGGEQNLARALGSGVRALGHACRVAIADGPRIAAAVARYGSSCEETDPDAPAQERDGRGISNRALVVPEGRGASAVRSLPIAALDLDGDVAAWLSDLGLRTCGDLQKLPRRALGTRLGAHAHDVGQMLRGEDRAPIDPWSPPPVPEERIDLEWAAASTGELAFVFKTLCDRLAARLEGRAMAAACIELVLGLDPAFCGGSPPRSTLEVVLPSPLARAGDLCAVVRARLEHETPAAPVLWAALRAPALAPIASRTLDLLTPEPRSARVLPRLVAELEAWLEPANVGTLELVDTWIPHERTRLVPLGRPRASKRPGSHPLVTSALEPSRLVRPFRTAWKSVAFAKLLARVEAVEWWRRGGGRHDLAAAWMVVGGGEPGRTSASRSGSEPCAGGSGAAIASSTHALAWVDLESQSEKEAHVTIRGWID